MIVFIIVVGYIVIGVSLGPLFGMLLSYMFDYDFVSWESNKDRLIESNVALGLCILLWIPILAADICLYASFGCLYAVIRVVGTIGKLVNFIYRRNS